MLIAALLMMAPVPTNPAPADPALFDPATGYRIAAYRGVVPAPPPGIPRLGDDAAAKAHDAGEALWIDVTPAAGAVHDPATGAWRLAEPHDTIPGAHWFPEAGRGNASPEIERWFADGVRRLTRGSRRRPIVAFCLADCWMSWNASWKLARLGYRHVAWYGNGVDGWREMGRPTLPAVPER